MRLSRSLDRLLFWNLCISLLIGILSATLCYFARSNVQINPGPGDFGYALRLAGDIWAHKDPYNYPVNPLAIPYPLTAGIVALPFIWLPVPLSSAVFFGLCSALLAYGILRTGEKKRLLIFLSAFYINSMALAQWSPLLMAMAYFPALLFLGVVKPQMAIPLGFSGFTKWTKIGVLVTLLLVGVSLIIMPTWPLRWFSQISQYQGLVPPLLTLPFGPLLLISILQFRKKEGRLFLLMALMPQRMYYDQLTLLLIPQSTRNLLILTLLSWLGFILGSLRYPLQQINILVFYLPVLANMFIETRAALSPSPETAQ